MRKPLVLSLLAVLPWTASSPAHSQVTAELREQLLAGQVVIRDAQVYAMASGAQRGTLESTQDWLVTRAMRSMAHKLCAFEPVPGQRLDVSLQGVTLVSAETRAQEMVVVIRAPVQKPSCKVTVAQPVQPPSLAPRSSDSQPRAADTVEPRMSDIVIRKFGGEY